MTPVPLDLPLRPSEAAELAGLIFEAAERKPLTDDVRNRVGARAVPLRFETMTPFFGSLERDPVHHSTYYIAVDAAEGKPYLLHMALATAPTSSIFAKPILIGRMRRAGGPEIVINALSFAPADFDTLDKFATHIGTAFLPRPQGARPTIVGDPFDPALFQNFRAIWKRTNRNVAAIGVETNFKAAYYAAVWAAIRAGWRDGYSAIARVTSKDQVPEAAAFSVFILEDQALQGTIRQTRSALKINRPCDFELALDRVTAPITPQELTEALTQVKVQMVAPNLGGLTEAQIQEIADICRQHQCTLDFTGDAALLESVIRATNGRLTCWGANAAEYLFP